MTGVQTCALPICFPVTIALAITSISGTVTIGSSVFVYYNKRLSTKTSFTYLFSYNGSTNSPFSMPIHYPDVSYPSGWTISTGKYTSGTPPSSAVFAAFGYSVVPSTSFVSTPDATYSTFPLIYGVTWSLNLIAIARDGSSPKEMLGIIGNAVNTLTVSASSFPMVTMDATVYRTAGPSLKSYLATRSSLLWFKYSNAKKLIKIPCVAGKTITVTGYVRTNDTAYVAGDCRASVYLGQTEITGSDISTGCINAWQGFTLTFTAAQTAEYVFAWKMYYENGAKSYWLDDFAVTST